MANEGFNVLVVDDNEMNRDTLSRRLEYEGFVASMAANGREALKMLRAGAFDLVLLDITMPEMDGYQVLRAIKSDRQLAHISVIMVSGINDLDSVMRCTELGADDYLTKPFDPVLLRAAIARSLKRVPTVVPAAPIKQRVTTLQKQAPPEPPQDLTLQQVVTEIINTGKLTRKNYMHFSKAIFNGLFSETSLSPSEYGQISIIFTYLQSGRIKVSD